MRVVKIIALLALFLNLNLFAYDSLVKNENYFNNAIKKSRQNNFGKDRIIAILDTGINQNSELKDKVIAEYDFTTNSSVAIDHDGHGTKIASIIAAANDGQGITGIAYNAKLIDAKVVDDNGNIQTENIIKAIEFAVKHGANVINMSFSSGEYSKELQEVIAKYAKKGVLFVAAAGNNGDNKVVYPAGYNYVVAVGSLDRKTGKRAIYSNYGEWIDEWVEDGIWTFDGKKYSREYGTSEASAVVSGTMQGSKIYKGYRSNCVKHLKYTLVDYHISSNDIETVNTLTVNEKDFFDIYSNISLYSKMNKMITATIFNDLNFQSLFNLDNEYNIGLDKKEIKIMLLSLFDEYLSQTNNIYNFNDFRQAVNTYYGNAIIKNTYSFLLKETTELKLAKTNEKRKKILMKMIKKSEQLNKWIAKKNDPKLKYYILKIQEYLNNRISTLKKDQEKLIEKAILMSKKINKYNKYLDNVDKFFFGLDSFLKIMDFSFSVIEQSSQQSQIDDLYKNFIAMKGVEFIEIMKSLKSDLYVGNKMSKGAQDFLNYINNIPSSIEGIKENFIPPKLSYDKVVVQGGSYFLEALLDFKILKDSPKILKNSLSLSMIILTHTIEQLHSGISNQVDFFGAKKNYLNWKSLIYNLKYKSFYISEDNYLFNSDRIKQQIAISLLEKIFFKSSIEFLIKHAKNDATFEGQTFNELISFKNNKLEINSIGLKKAAFDAINVVANSISIIWTDFGKNTLLSDIQFMGGKGKLIDFRWYFWNILNSKQYREHNALSRKKVISDFVSKANIIFRGINSYQYYLINLLKYDFALDEIYNDNNKNDILTKWQKIKNTAEMIAERDKLSKNEDIKVKLMLNLDHNYYYGYSLFDYRDIKKLGEPINRKDFFIMMLKAIKYNPYQDKEFMDKFFDAILKNKKDFFFNDLDDEQNGKKLTLNEKIWLTYGKYKSIINGDNNRVLPFNTVNRATAMAIVGRIYKQFIGKKNYTEIASNKVKELNIIDYYKVNKNYSYFKDDIDVCLAEGIIVGAGLNDGSRTLMLDNKLTYNGAITIALRVDNGINKEKAKRFLNSIGKFLDNYFPTFKEQESIQNIFQKYTNSLPTIKGGQINKIKIKTVLKKEVLNKFQFKWLMAGAQIDKVENRINENGFIEFYIYVKPEWNKEPYILPLEVVVTNMNGDSLSKSFYYQVVNEETNSNNLTTSTIQFIPQYLQNNQFKINWQIENAKSVIFDYSFDKTNWKRFDFINLITSSKTESNKTIDEAKNHNKIYFRAKVKDKNNNFTSKIKELYYMPKKEYVEKATEIPARTTIYGYQNGTTNSVKICWRKIIDSHKNLNVNYYELIYAKSNTSGYNLIKVQDNSDAEGRNCKIISNLKDGIEYYFKVRGCNSIGCGEWSNKEYITIKIPHNPEFITDYQYPKNGAKNVSKLTDFRWSVKNVDYNDVDFKVYWGETKDKLNCSSRGWTKNNFVELDEPLKPNTTYYWKVLMRSNGKRFESPTWSFITANKGYDLTITDAKLISELKPNSEATFRLTVKNIGDEKAVDAFIRAYYKKGDKVSEFRIGSSRIGKELSPGETTTVDIRVKFQDYIIEPNQYNGYQEYDNILVTGESYVIFDMPYLKYDGQDINFENNKKEVKIVYKNKGAPNFEYFDVRFNGFLMLHPSDSYKDREFYAIIGKKLQIVADVVDDIRCDRAKIEYRTDKDENWHLIREFKDNQYEYMHFDWKDEYGNYHGKQNGYDWIIPENLKDKNIQIRVTVYDDQGLSSYKVSRFFPIYSNHLKISNIQFDKDEYNVGDVVTVIYDIENDNDILGLYGDMISGTTYLHNVVKEFYKDGGQLSGTFSFKIPDNNRYANDNAYVRLRVVDIYGNEYKINSKTFKIKPQTKLDSIFSKAIRLFKNPALPQNASYKNQWANLEFVRIDSNNIVHTIVSYKEKYFIDTQNGDKPDELHYKEKNYYIAYDYNTKQIIKKIEIPKGDIVSMELNENDTPYILIKRDRQLFYSYLEGNSFVKEKNILNPIVPKASSSYVSQVDSFNHSARGSKSVYLNNNMYDIDGPHSFIYRYNFNNGIISNQTKINLSGDVWLSSTPYIKPVVIGNKIYSIDEDTHSKIIETDIANKTLKTYPLPFALDKNIDYKKRDRYVSPFSIANGNGTLYFFARGKVYKLNGDTFIEVGDIKYEFDGESVSFKNDWSEHVDKLFTVTGNGKIYLVMKVSETKKPRNFSSYEILEFDPTTETFSKKVIDAERDYLNNTHSHSGFGSNGDIEDYIYYKGKLLVLSLYTSPFSNIKFYDVGLNMLDLETGDIISLGALDIPAKHLRFIKEDDGDIYIISENYDYKEKSYKLNLKNINEKLNYFRSPEIKKFNEKLLITYEYGNIFDGRYSGYKTENNYYYSVNRQNRYNKLIEIYPDISEEYKLYNQYLNQWNYENNLVYSSSKGAIYQTNEDGSIAKELYKESKYDNGGGFSYSYSDRYMTSFLKYNDYLSILDKQNNLTTTGIMVKNSKDVSYLYDDFMIHIGYKDSKYKIDKYYYEDNQTSSIVFDKGDNEPNNLSSANSKSIVAIGWGIGEPYIAVADFSKDIVAPEVKFENNETGVEKGKDIILKWNAKDNNDELMKLELYKIVDGNEKLLKDFTNIQENSFKYHIDEKSNFIQFKIKAYDLSGNSSYDILPLKIVEPIIFKSFNVNKTDLNLGDKIIFTWSSNGNRQTEYIIYKKEIHSNVWSVLCKVKGVNSKVYEVKDFIGSYQFKIVSGNQELVSSQIVKINGDLLSFNYGEFYPKGEFVKDKDNSIILKWNDNSKETLNYEVWIKIANNQDFKKVGVTNNKFFNYVLKSDKTFIWKVSTNYKNKYVESDEIMANPVELLAPYINNIELHDSHIEINFTKVKDAKKYKIYRSPCNDIYKSIDEVEFNYYKDYDIFDKACLSYKIVAIADDNIMSSFSNEKSINMDDIKSYNVIIENQNNSLINDNKIVLNYHPDREVNFEKYEILIGKNPNNLTTYLITDERNITIKNLDYGTIYYVEIYPLDIRGQRLNILPAKLTFITGFDKREITQKPIVTIEEVSKNYIILGWNEISNSDYYEIYRSDDSKNFEYLYKTNDTKFVDNINLISGATYYYKVKAVNKNSFSISDVTQVTIPKDCTQVTTHAYNPKTGEEKDFSTPCDVPEGWVVGDAPDSDGDGVNDIKDAFPNDPSASVDSDGDGYPDNWNDGESAKDSTTGLILDNYPNDPNRWEKSDTTYNFSYSKGWSLKALPIKNEINASILPNVSIIWKYRNGKWMAYSQDTDTEDKIKNLNYKTFMTIRYGDGFWIYSSKRVDMNIKGVDYTLNDINLTNISKGWFLVGSGNDINVSDIVSIINTTSIIWKYRNGKWMAYSPDSSMMKKIEDAGIEKLKTIEKDEGFWIYSNGKLHKVLSYSGKPKKDEELIFDYNYDGDDCSINFHDGSGDISLDSCVGTIHHTFTKENVYNVELKSNEKTVENSVVVIENEDNHWIGFVSSLNNYIEDNEKYSDIVKDGRIYLSPSLTNEDYYWTNYRFIKPNLLNKINGDDFTIEAKIKVPLSEGGISCYDPRIAAIGENGKQAEVTFMSEGCTYYASIGAADWYQSGGAWNCDSENSTCEDVDLSLLGRDFSDWKVIKMNVKDKKLSVYYDNEKIYTMSYKGSVGKLIGVYTSFKGSGSVDWVKIYDNEGKLVYSEDFNK